MVPVPKWAPVEGELGDLPKLRLAHRKSPLPALVPFAVPTEVGVMDGGRGVNGVWGDMPEEAEADEGEG